MSENNLEMREPLQQPNRGSNGDYVMCEIASRDTTTAGQRADPDRSNTLARLESNFPFRLTYCYMLLAILQGLTQITLQLILLLRHAIYWQILNGVWGAFACFMDALMNFILGIITTAFIITILAYQLLNISVFFYFIYAIQLVNEPIVYLLFGNSRLPWPV
jgi:hypothetical protein